MIDIIDFGVEPTAIDGLLIVTMKQVTDERGTVREASRASALAAAGVRVGPWQQVNVTETIHGALRGLHAEAMTKLVGVVSGSAFGVYLDLRTESVSHGEVVTVELVPGRQVLVPDGVANGFQVTSREPAQYLYCFDSEWEPGMAGQACTPLDPDLAIAWPVPIDPADPSQISTKDRDAPRFADLRSDV